MAPIIRLKSLCYSYMEKDMKEFIYVLADPRSGEIKYVGKTINLSQRYKQHIRAAQNCGDSYVNKRLKWIAKLLENGFEPIMQVIDIVPENEDWRNYERGWVEFFRMVGCALLNTAPAGGGWVPGTKHSEETKERIRKAMIGREIDEEWRQNISEACKGRTPWNKGQSRREETKRKISETKKKQYEENPDLKEKISEGVRRFAEANPDVVAKTAEKNKQAMLEVWDKKKGRTRVEGWEEVFNVDSFRQHINHLKPETVDAYITCIERLSRFIHENNIKLGKLTQKDLSIFKKWLRNEEQCSMSVFELTGTGVRRFLKFAEKRNMVTKGLKFDT